MFSWIAQGLKNIVDAITNGIKSIYNFLVNLNDNIANWILNAVNSIGEFFTNVGTWIGNLGTNIGNWFSELGTNLGNWLSYINPFSENFFGYKLIEMLKNLFTELFVPSTDVLTELQETVSSKFGFVDSIKLAISDIQEMMENIENGSAKLTVDIDSKYYQGEATMLDLGWYAKFKDYGDLVFTGFLYILFFWRLYKSIPNILAGISSFTGGAE